MKKVAFGVEQCGDMGETSSWEIRGLCTIYVMNTMPPKHLIRVT